jgi:hypothetical protein
MRFEALKFPAEKGLFDLDLQLEGTLRLLMLFKDDFRK